MAGRAADASRRPRGARRGSPFARTVDRHRQGPRYFFAGGGGGSVGSVTSVLGYRDSLSMFLTYLYQEAFVNHKYGYASALAMVIFVISLILTAIVLVIFQRFTHYQEQ